MPRFSCWFEAQDWKRPAERLQKEALAIYFVFKHPGVPWYAKFVAACAAAYLLSPIQLIPSFLPGIGFLDDLLVLFLSSRLLRRIVLPGVLEDCRALAEAVELKRQERIRFVTIVTLCLLASLIASVWIVIPHRR
jgi:uncharacterized membrane protein YkvA (DUF1232 family)